MDKNKKTDCIFCKIVAGEIPCSKVYEDDKILSFIDINPINYGHALVLPKEHYDNIYETPDEIAKLLFTIAKKIAIAQKKSLSADGVNIQMNNDLVAGQLVFHTHLHIIPRFTNDGFTHWHGKPYKSEEEKESYAQKIKSTL